MNPKVDQYLTKARTWQKESELLRAIILKFPLTEELKWGKPCYAFQESNLLIIQGFKEYCALMFCQGALLKDALEILVKPGENTQAARQARFTSAREIIESEPVLTAYIQEAIEAAMTGLEVTYKTTEEFVIPEELKQRLHEDPKLQTAFSALTPGRQRGYFLHIAAAKQAKTRESRIDKCLPLIFEGKGLND